MATEVRERSIKDKLSEDTSEQEENKPKYWDPLSDGLKWIENYAEPLEKFFERLPDFISTIVATFAVFTFGSTLRVCKNRVAKLRHKDETTNVIAITPAPVPFHWNIAMQHYCLAAEIGEWVVILVSALKQISGHTQSERNLTTEEIYKLFTLENLKMENFAEIFISAHIVSFGIYFGIGGFLHWYFYVKRKHLAHEWKIQPTKWISSELERHEILLGTLSLIFTGSFSAFLACYIMNENPSSVYYQFDEYGWWWFFLQFPVIFVYKDYTTYIMHRMYHTPFLYKHFHKVHHKYKQPTAFAVTAIHPVEIIHIQLTMALPLFAVPIHWFAFFSVAMYNYYHGIIDHSGINFKTQWWQPWQPPAEFHDLHHQYFHCNFGFNMSLWDKWHGTMRKPNLVYTEDTYHGEAPPIESEEGKKMIEIDGDIMKEYAEEYIKRKSNLNAAE